VGEQRGTSAEQGGNGELFQSTLHVGDILCQRQKLGAALPLQS